MTQQVEVKLSPRPDGYGFYYGEAPWVTRSPACVLAAASLWDGDVQLENNHPDPEQWIIYVDGEEIAGVKRREDLAAAMVRRLIR